MEKKLDILLGIYITSLVAAELLGSKFTTILGISTSVGIIALPFTFIINDVVTEIAGKERARHFVRTGLYMLVFLFVLILVARLLPVAKFYTNNAAYNSVFKNSMRIVIASLSAYFVSEQLDILIFSKIRQKLKRFLWLRSNASNILSLFIDTSVFMFIAFYHAQPQYTFAKIVALIIPYWGLKILFTTAQTPLTYLGVYWLKRKQSNEPERIQESAKIS